MGYKAKNPLLLPGKTDHDISPDFYNVDPLAKSISLSFQNVPVFKYLSQCTKNSLVTTGSTLKNLQIISPTFEILADHPLPTIAPLI